MKKEKKKKSVEKCKGADVKAIPENSIYLSIMWIVSLISLKKMPKWKASYDSDRKYKKEWEKKQVGR